MLAFIVIKKKNLLQFSKSSRKVAMSHFMSVEASKWLPNSDSEVLGKIFNFQTKRNQV